MTDGERPEVLRLVLEDHDPRDATIHYATEGMISTSDLWRLYEEHRILAPADAFLLALMWQGELPTALVDETLSDPAWWRCFDAGPRAARDRN